MGISEFRARHDLRSRRLGRPRESDVRQRLRDPAAYRAFLEKGRWPDQTMFILEVRRSIGKGSINKGGHYQGDVMTVEAAVKEEERFPQKWAYFGFGRSDKSAPLPANSACNSCHERNAAVENTFVQFYPALLDVATHKGTLNRAYVLKSADK